MIKFDVLLKEKLTIKRYRKKLGRLTPQAVFALETWLVNNFAEPCKRLEWMHNHKCSRYAFFLGLLI